jgi:carnosine N-methyltransferase
MCVYAWNAACLSTTTFILHTIGASLSKLARRRSPIAKSVLTVIMPLRPEDIEEEERAFAKVVVTFQQYARYAVRIMWNITANFITHATIFIFFPQLWISISLFTRFAHQIAANNRRRKDIYLLPRADQELLGSLGYKEKLADVDKAVAANAEFLKQIVANTQIFGGDHFGDEDLNVEETESDAQPTQVDELRAQSHSHGWSNKALF